MHFFRSRKAEEKEAFYKRPDSLSKFIDKAFVSVEKSEEVGGYLFKGSDSYGADITRLMVSSKTTLEKSVAMLKDGDQALQVLDIGGGDFSFNSYNQRYDGKVITYAIAANDACRKGKEKKDYPHSYCVFGNAEQLSRLKELKDIQFDYIYSRLTFVHFVDPIGSIIEAYKKLKVGGVLMIDKFFIPGCEGKLNEIIQHLQAQGYRVAVGQTHNFVTNFIIQKTEDKPDLFFPVEFSGIKDEQAFYKLLSDTKRKNEFIKTDDDWYQEGKKLINFEISECKCENLAALLIDEVFLRSEPMKQFQLILYVVSKSIKQASLSDKLIEEEVKRSEDFKVVYNCILQDNTQKCLLDLYYDPYFCSLNREQQLKLIEIAAVKTIMDYAKMKVNEEILKQMKLPTELRELQPTDKSFKFNKINEDKSRDVKYHYKTI